MRVWHFKFAAILFLALSYSGWAYAANHVPRTCNSILPGGLGGTGNTTVIPPGGIGGNGIEASIGGIGGTGNTPIIPPGGIGGNGIEASSGGIGGTGNTTITPPGGIGSNGIQANNDPTVPPGGIGGTGITMAGNIVALDGEVTVINNNQRLRLSKGDAVCVGDHISTGINAQAKIGFTDSAVLFLLANSNIEINDYLYSEKEPKNNRSQISLIKGDIRSVSGAISKLNPKQYAIKTPIASIHVIGTDFLVTHLATHEGALDTGTYTKVISGEVMVSSPTATIHLRAGESSHVMLNGTQSIINSGGGTCSAP
jgi:hypothetical protein